jgi:rubrerythrin
VKATRTITAAEQAVTPLARLRCVECGYGASRPAPPERCPICDGEVWEHEPWRPFSKSALRPFGE